MRTFLPSIAALLAAMPSSLAGNVCLAESNACGPRGGCGSEYRVWGPGREPCGDQSVSLRGLFTPQALRICNDNANLVSTGPGEFDLGIEVNGQVYPGQRVQEDDAQNCSEGCNNVVVHFGEVYWPEVPICN